MRKLLLPLTIVGTLLTIHIDASFADGKFSCKAIGPNSRCIQNKAGDVVSINTADGSYTKQVKLTDECGSGQKLVKLYTIGHVTYECQDIEDFGDIEGSNF